MALHSIHFKIAFYLVDFNFMNLWDSTENGKHSLRGFNYRKFLEWFFGMLFVLLVCLSLLRLLYLLFF